MHIPLEVQFGEMQIINRETLVQNEVLITIALTHLGTRVSIRSLEIHIRATYDLMTLAVPSALA